MSTVRFNRIHFFKRFDPTADFILLKDMTIAGVEVKQGDRLDKNLLPIHKIRRLFDTRKITPEISLYENVTNISTSELTKDEERDTIDLIPEIVQAGPAWKKVMLGDKQLGKTIRTDEEAQEIINEWLESKDN